jgi:hypothetical protein
MMGEDEERFKKSYQPKREEEEEEEVKFREK